MQFLYPTFLFALATLAIPIILHLFYFRRFKRVYFTNVRFLKEVKEETSARSKLRNLLVLLMRLLALAFLVLAFAQPFIPQDVEVKQGLKAISLFVDNSFSMQASSQDVSLLDKAKQRAVEIIDAYSVEDRFQILTNDFEGRHQRLVGKDDAISLVDEIQIGPKVRKLSTVMARQKQALNSESIENQVAFMITDFQRNIADIESYADSTVELNLVPLQSVQEKNISIDSAWFDSPIQMLNQTNQLVIKVNNRSEEIAENYQLSIRYDGQSRPVGTLSIPPQSTITDTVPITILRTGWHEAQLKITDYPINFDDDYFFTFNIAKQINVLAINDNQANRYLGAAFSRIQGFELTNLTSQNLDYSRLSEYQLIILNDLINISSGLAFELKQYVEEGGNLLVFPARNANVSSYQGFLQAFPANELVSYEDVERIVGEVNIEEFIFKDVFENRTANLKLPSSRGNYKLSNFNSRQEERLLTYRDGSAFLSKFRTGQGHLYLCAAPLDTDYNDLVRNGEIFIPMLYKMAISAGKSQPIAYTIGQDEVIETDHKGGGDEIVYKIQGKGEEFIPQKRIIGSKAFLTTGQQIREAGFYNIFLNPDTILNVAAFNYSREESDLRYLSESELRSKVGELANIIKVGDTAVLTARIEEQSQGIVLWRWCLILALMFLAFEVLLLRFWKV